MQFKINNIDMSKYQIDDDFNYSFIKDNEIAVERTSLNMVTIPEFDILDDKYILNSGVFIEGAVYKNNGTLLQKGELVILENDYNDMTTVIEIVPELKKALDSYPQYYYDISPNQTPAKILKEIFINEGLIDYLHLPTLDYINEILKSYGVYLGLDMNLLERSYTLLDMLNDFRNTLQVEMYIVNNKIHFDTSLFDTRQSYELQKVVDYTTEYNEEEIINDYTITSPNHNFKLEDFDTETGKISREKYGVQVQDISPQIFIVEKNALVQSTWIDYLVQVMKKVIAKKQNPIIIISIDLFTNIIEEINLNDLISFNGIEGYVVEINRSNTTANVVLKSYL